MKQAQFFASLIAILFLLLFTAFTAHAQRGWEVGGGVGISYYFGDLNSNFDLSTPGVAATAVGRYNFNNRLCLKFSGSYAYVSADDANSSNSFEKARNLNFSSHVVEGAAQFEFNFLPYTHGSRDEFFTPYLFAGLNVFYFNPRTQFEGEWVDLRPLGTEGQFRGDEYYTVQPGLIYGMGMKFDITPVWSMNVELNHRRLFTDYLDDVSGVYPEMDDLEAQRGEIAVMLSDRSIPDINEIKIGQPGRQRGSDGGNDSYMMFTIGMVYYFGDIRCPSFYN